MAAGIGFVRDALNSAKRNRDHLKSKSNFQQTYKTKTPHKALKFNKMSPDALASFKEGFKQKQRSRYIRDVVLAVVIFLLILIAAGLTLF